VWQIVGANYAAAFARDSEFLSESRCGSIILILYLVLSNSYPHQSGKICLAHIHQYQHQHRGFDRIRCPRWRVIKIVPDFLLELPLVALAFEGGHTFYFNSKSASPWGALRFYGYDWKYDCKYLAGIWNGFHKLALLSKQIFNENRLALLDIRDEYEHILFFSSNLYKIKVNKVLHYYK